VKIKGTHSVCGRELLVDQIIQAKGHCPWDGVPLNKDYTGVLATALQEAQRAGSHFEAALEQIADMHPDLALDEDSVLGTIRAQVARQTGARPVRT
jgi:hypothetical protein